MQLLLAVWGAQRSPLPVGGYGGRGGEGEAEEAEPRGVSAEEKDGGHSGTGGGQAEGGAGGRREVREGGG